MTDRSGLNNPNANRIDLSNDYIAYILGVVESDGWVGRDGSDYIIKLEVTDESFADKFANRLEILGLNPMKHKSIRDGDKMLGDSNISTYTITAYCKELVDWMEPMDIEDMTDYIKGNNNRAWLFIEGMYEGDGSLAKRDYTDDLRITTTRENGYKSYIVEIFEQIGIRSTIRQNNVAISAEHHKEFLNNIDCSIKNRTYKKYN